MRDNVMAKSCSVGGCDEIYDRMCKILTRKREKKRTWKIILKCMLLTMSARVCVSVYV